MKAEYKYSDIIQDNSPENTSQTCDTVSEEQSHHYDVPSEHTQVKLNNLFCSPHPTCKPKSYELQPVLPTHPPWVLKTSKVNFLSNLTIKWTGNNKEICKLSLVTLHLLLFFLLVDKIAILSSKLADSHRNTSLSNSALKSASLLQIDDTSNSSLRHELHQSTGFNTMPTSTPSIAEECQKVEASSENEYKSKLENITEESPICLIIYFQDNSNWKLENSSFRLEMVKELILMGNTDTAQLSVVLDKFNFAYKISFGQLYNKFYLTYHTHHGHSVSRKKSKIYLLNLTEINFENINSTQVFDYLSKAFYMNAVRSLRVKRIVIDKNNIMGIRELLKQCKYSLEVLDLSGVMWKVALFNSFAYAVPNLKELLIDFLFPLDTNVEFLGGFKASEHLSKIVSRQGYLPYSQFSSIFDFKLIKYLTLGVELTDDVSSLDGLFPINAISKLEYVELYLKFSNTTKCYLLLDYDIERSYETKLHSNCDEDF